MRSYRAGMVATIVTGLCALIWLAAEVAAVWGAVYWGAAADRASDPTNSYANMDEGVAMIFCDVASVALVPALVVTLVLAVLVACRYRAAVLTFAILSAVSTLGVAAVEAAVLRWAFPDAQGAGLWVVAWIVPSTVVLLLPAVTTGLCWGVLRRSDDGGTPARWPSRKVAMRRS